MIIRKFTQADARTVGQLFYETVHTINAQDYPPELLNMWAPANDEFAQMIRNCEANVFYVAEIDTVIVGFGDMTVDGYLERLFVHKDFQGKRIGTTLMDAIEKQARLLALSSIRTEASVRAQPFFERHGFKVVKRLYKKHAYKGVDFITYKMIKTL